jgi:hypothetical protein
MGEILQMKEMQSFGNIEENRESQGRLKGNVSSTKILAKTFQIDVHVL